MEDMIPCAVKDREVFQRVWQRVMAGRSEDSSPIQPGIPGGWEGDVPCECLEALMRQEGGGMPPECERPVTPELPTQKPECPPCEPEAPAEPELPTQKPECPPCEPEAPAEPEPPAQKPECPPCEPEVPAEPEPPVQKPECPPCGAETPMPEPPAPEDAPSEGLPEADGPHRGNDLPRLWEEPQNTDDRTARLRRHVMDALEGWQFYRYLARRARGTDARALNSMAAEQHKEARKLSAAYFLLTGLRYWPSEMLGTPSIPSYWGALRTRHQAEQRQENAYRLAADDWDDPDLLALYDALAEGCQRRSHQLRSLLEQGNT